MWWLGLYKTVSWQMIIKDLMKYCLFDTRLRWSVKLYSSWFLYIVMWITKHKIHRPKILIQNLPVKQTVKEKWSTITFLTFLQNNYPLCLHNAFKICLFRVHQKPFESLFRNLEMLCYILTTNFKLKYEDNKPISLRKNFSKSSV